MNPLFHNWRWVLLYIAVLYSLLPVVGPLSRWANTHHLDELIHALPPLFLAAGAVLLVRKFRALPQRRRIAWLIFAVIGCLYCLLMAYGVQAPVERFHTILFIGLALLVYGTYRKTTHGFRVEAYSIILIACTSFVHEAIQGIMSTRIYDTRDIALDIVSGLLAIVVLRTSARPAATRPPVSYASTDLIALCTAIVVASGMVFCRRTAVSPGHIVGVYITESNCGRPSRLDISRDGSITWSDNAGNHSEGLYTATWNVFGETILSIQGTNAMNLSPCGWQKGWKGTSLIFFDRGILSFYNDPALWKKAPFLTSTHH